MQEAQECLLCWVIAVVLTRISPARISLHHENEVNVPGLLQEIPLGEAKQAAVEDGVAAYENLLSKLTDVPTPAGPTPRQIGAGFVQVTSVRPALPASTLTDSRSNGAGSREPD